MPATSSDGGTGDSACAQLPASLQNLLCPSAEGGDEATSSSTSGNATSGTGSSATSGGTTGGTSGTTGATTTTGTSGATGSTASQSGGVVSAFLAWLAGVFQSVGL